MTHSSDRFIPYYFVIFFIVLAFLLAMMILLAIRTDHGVIIDHPYERGLAYNQVIKAAKEQEALQWKEELSYKALPHLRVELHFLLYDAKGGMIQPDHLQAVLIRPSKAGLEKQIALSSPQTVIAFPLPGLWEIRIYAKKGRDQYQTSIRVIVHE